MMFRIITVLLLWWCYNCRVISENNQYMLKDNNYTQVLSMKL